MNNFFNTRCILVRWMSTIIDCCFRAVFVLYPVLLKRDMCAKTFFALFRQEYSEPCQTSKMERYSENSKTLKLRHFRKCYEHLCNGSKGSFFKALQKKPKNIWIKSVKIKKFFIKTFLFTHLTLRGWSKVIFESKDFCVFVKPTDFKICEVIIIINA